MLARTAGVRTAGGSLQGSPLLQTGLQRCGDGVAKGDREAHGPVCRVVKYYVSGCGAVG